MLFQRKTESPAMISSNTLRILFLAVGFLTLIIVRKFSGSFGVSLGYVYTILIALSGFWFGIRGGVITASIGSIIFLFEVNLFRIWTFRDLAIRGMFFRILTYFLAGVGLGYLSDIEKRLRDTLKELAYHDELTGCVNFRWTMRILEKEVERSRRYNKELSIVMIDIDHFKNINDTYGHLVGNDILKDFAKLLKDTVRAVDVVGRYGGEEFLLILPEANVSQSLIVVDRIRKKLSQTRFMSSHLKGKSIKIKFSAGIASFPYNASDVGELIAVADNALYQAKREGRDRVVFERRKWLRVTPVGPLKIELVDTKNKEGKEALKVLNISREGALLLFPDEVPDGDIYCRLHFPQEGKTYEFNCQVVHKDKKHEDLYHVGVYFVKMPPEAEKNIFRDTDIT